MDTKNILTGIAGLMLGGLIVSVAASSGGYRMMGNSSDSGIMQGMSMGQMNTVLSKKSGDDFDKAFLAGMIQHHEGAVTMAKQAAKQAKHEEIKTMAASIIAAQEKEIDMMQGWRQDWGYKTVPSTDHGTMEMH